MPARAFRALAGGPAALLVPSPAVPAATSRPEGLPPPAPLPVGAAHHIRIQSRAPIPAGLISALWSTASTRGGLTNTARHPARAGAWPRSLTDAPDAPWDHAGWEMPPQSSPNPSRPASRCAECLQLSAWLAARRCQLWAGQRPRAGSAVLFCLVPAAWEHPSPAQACPTGPSHTQDGAKPTGEPWWRSWVMAHAHIPPTLCVITSHELSRGNEAGTECCRVKLWCQQGAGQSLQLPAPNAPGSGRPTSQLRSGTLIRFNLAPGDPGFSKNQKEEHGCSSDGRDTKRPLLLPSPFPLYLKKQL